MTNDPAGNPANGSLAASVGRDRGQDPAAGMNQGPLVSSPAAKNDRDTRASTAPVLAFAGGTAPAARAVLDRFCGDDVFRRRYGIAAQSVSSSYRRNSLFLGALSLEDNLRFFARLTRCRYNEILTHVNHFNDADFNSSQPFKNVLRIAEIAVFSILPYDCLVVEDIWQVPASLRQFFFETTAARGVSVVFASRHLPIAKQYADKIVELGRP